MKVFLVLTISLGCITGICSCGTATAKKPEIKLADTAHQSKQEPDPPPTASYFQAFLQSLINTTNLVPDTAWRHNLKDTDMQITAPSISDDDGPDTVTYFFPFSDIEMSYRIVHFGIENDPDKSCGDGSQFTINHVKLPLDKECGRCYPLITPQTIRRYKYRGMRFITMWGGLRSYNGYGDRIQFNYFFDISHKPYVQNIYDNADGRIYQPVLYGDLNNDTLLDRLVFDGLYYPFCEDTCMVTITAETYRNRKWQPLKDKKNKPYYIEVHIDGQMDSFSIKTYNWMRALK